MRPVFRHRARVALLAALPMLLGVAGVLIDERTRLGFTIWKASCRTSGFALRPLIHFTLELLPLGVIGALTGGVLVLAFGAGGAHRARESLAAHLGCVLAMPMGLVLCLLALPVAVTLGLELALAAALALLVSGAVVLGSQRA